MTAIPHRHRSQYGAHLVHSALSEICISIIAIPYPVTPEAEQTAVQLPSRIFFALAVARLHTLSATLW
jgi:hypothetical protein